MHSERFWSRRIEMHNRSLNFGLLALMLICSVVGYAQHSCIPSPNPPKLPMARASGRFNSSAAPLRVVQLAGISDSWKATRREIGSVPSGTMVEVLEDRIVVDAPDVVRVTNSIDALNLKEGDKILRYARLGEGWADIWAEGCWYRAVNADFITEPDGAGCGGTRCSARVTKLGSQTWWFRILRPDGKSGWTQSQNLDLSAGG
jgi:hypothetical protein